jgi:hypothetical protein
MAAEFIRKRNITRERLNAIRGTRNESATENRDTPCKARGRFFRIMCW